MPWVGWGSAWCFFCSTGYQSPCLELGCVSLIQRTPLLCLSGTATPWLNSAPVGVIVYFHDDGIPSGIKVGYFILLSDLRSPRLWYLPSSVADQVSRTADTRVVLWSRLVCLHGRRRSGWLRSHIVSVTASKDTISKPASSIVCSLEIKPSLELQWENRAALK